MNINRSPGTKMHRVLEKLEAGMRDREEIAESLGLTVKEVTSAIYNLKFSKCIVPERHTQRGLRMGRGYTLYKPADGVFIHKNPLHGVSSIFNVRIGETS